jgi:glycosyltransferase involved in cell wall biosynthesis
MKTSPTRVVICRSNSIVSDPRVDKIARALAGAGYSVQLLGWDNIGGLPLKEEREGIQIERRRIIIKNARGLGVLPYELRWQAALMSWLIRRHTEIDVIHACDFDTVLPALLCKRLWGIRVVYDIFDFYADMLRATPGFLKRLIRFLELRAIDQADTVILADESRREQITGSHPRRIEVIYNSPEGSAGGSIPSPTSLPQTGELQIAYVGNLQVERGLLELLSVLSKHPEWKLDLAGFGPDETLIVAKALQVPNVTWHGRIPYTRAMELNALADVIIATYSPQIPNHRFSSPNKLFEAMLLGKPVIVARNTNVDRIVEEAGCGVVVDYGDLAGLEAALSQLQQSPALCQKLGERGRIAYEKTYAWKNMKTRLLQLYQDLAL